MRYLTGFTLAEGEEKVAGNSGQFLVSGDEVAVLADSRYTIQARREAPDARLVEAYNDLPSRWADLVASVGARRVGGRGRVRVARRLGAAGGGGAGRRAGPGRGLGGGRPGGQGAGRDRADRGRLRRRRPGAGRAAARRSGPGVTEADAGAAPRVARSATGGAEALAFDVACLSGPEAALPHGAPGDRPVLDGTVLLFDFGAQVVRLPERHDPDAVRRRAIGARPGHL